MLNKLLAEKLSLEEIKAVIDRAAEFVYKNIETGNVIIFGSAARLEMTTASDFDLAVIVRDESLVRPTRKKLTGLCAHLDGLPVDLVVYDEQTYAEKSQIGGLPFIIREEGLILNRADYVS